MSRFVATRHQPPQQLDRQRELVVACPPMRSNVNLSRIIRMAGCCGVSRVVACGTAKVHAQIARDAVTEVQLEVHRTLLPVLHALRREEYQLVGLEQAKGSEPLTGFCFQRRTVLVIGNERSGMEQSVLDTLDRVAEIPVWGLPYSYNVATAACLAMYEYCRQFPSG